MKKVKVKKLQKSPIKTDLLDAGRLMVNTIEHQSKDLAYKLEGWNKKFLQLTQSIEEIEKAIKKEITVKPSDLGQQYSESNAILSKLTKEIETLEKSFHNNKKTLHKKLVEPSKNPLSPTNQENLENIKKIIQEIESTLERDQKILNEISSKCQKLTVRLLGLENEVDKFCLSDRLEKVAELSEKFTKCVASLCEDITNNTLQRNPTESQQKCLLLFRQNMKLLASFQSKLEVPSPDQDTSHNGAALVAPL